MCNTTIAKAILKRLTTRTERELYYLKYEGGDYDEMSETLFKVIKSICKIRGIAFPLYKWGGVINLKKDDSTTYLSLNILADEYNIILDITKF